MRISTTKRQKSTFTTLRNSTCPTNRLIKGVQSSVVCNRRSRLLVWVVSKNGAGNLLCTFRECVEVCRYLSLSLFLLYKTTRHVTSNFSN